MFGQKVSRVANAHCELFGGGRAFGGEISDFSLQPDLRALR
jgi:hypothetical protein